MTGMIGQVLQGQRQLIMMGQYYPGWGSPHLGSCVGMTQFHLAYVPLRQPRAGQRGTTCSPGTGQDNYRLLDIYIPALLSSLS